MIREHLYKAKRVNWRELPKEKWWVEGFYVQLPKPSLGAAIIAGLDLCSEDVSDYIIVNKSKQHSNFSNAYPLEVVECEQYEVDPETVCECAGLTDKNGVKIFEGDVLKQKTTKFFKKYNTMEWIQYGIVRFGEYDFTSGVAGGRTVCFYLEHLKSESIFPKNYCVGKIYAGLNQGDILEKFYPYEVIGNVFDNPELLKGDGIE